MKSCTRVEILESRVAPATLSFTEGVLVYNAGNNVSNDLTFDIVGANIVITDNAETITLAGAPFVLSNGNKTATGAGANVAVVVLQMGNSTDIVRIFAADDQMNVSGTGTLSLTIGDGSAKDIRNIISIDEASGASDSILFNGGTEATPTTVTVGSSFVGAPGDTFFGPGGSVGISGMETVTVRTGTAASTVKVLSTAAGTTTNITSAGAVGTPDDTVLVGEAGSLQGIAGTLSISNPAFSVVTFDNSADTTGRNVTITSSSITGLAPAVMNFVDGDTRGITVLGGTGADTFEINGIQSPSVGFSNVINGGGGGDVFNIRTAGSAATFLGGAGDDIFNVGNAGSVNTVTANLIVQGGGDTGDLLVLNDFAVAASDTYTITSSTIDRPIFGSVIYSGFPRVDLNAQTGDNTFLVSSTAAGTLLSINGNDGNDTFTIGTAGSLDGILGLIAIDGQAGDNDGISLADNAQTIGRFYSCTSTTFSRDGVLLVSSIAGVEGIGLGAGSGDDTLNATNATSGINFGAGAGADNFFGSPSADLFIGGSGTDTFTSLGIAGDATVTDTGITYPGGNNDSFPGTDVEVVRLAGDTGVNQFNATAFAGFAILDGVSGKDVITGSDVTFAAKSVTFKDGDGDTVVIKSTKARIGAQHLGLMLAANGTGAHLQSIDLLGDQAFKGAAITLKAKASAAGGDSFVNVGFINAAGIDLAAVSIPGDLGRILAGDADTGTAGLGKLTVGSLYAYGIFTQAPGGVNSSIINGKVGSLLVRSSLGLGGFTVDGAATPANGSIGSIKINGSHLGLIVASGGIGSVNILKSFVGANLFAGGAIGTVKVGGDLSGTIAAGFDAVFAPVSQAKSVVLKNLIVGGDARFAQVFAGGTSAGTTFNADASIGSITVLGDWIQSSVSAGVSAMNSFFGDAGDMIGVGKGGDFDAVAGGNPEIVATIASITVRGQVSGTFPDVNSTDHFGFVAQQITSFRVGTAKLALVKNQTDAAFLLGPTGDVAAREIG